MAPIPTSYIIAGNGNCITVKQGVNTGRIQWATFSCTNFVVPALQDAANTLFSATLSPIHNGFAGGWGDQSPSVMTALSVYSIGYDPSDNGSVLLKF